MHSRPNGCYLSHGLHLVVTWTEKDAHYYTKWQKNQCSMHIMCRKGKTVLKTVLYSLFPKAKSGALLSGHCRGTHVGSAVLLCRAATDQLWESVLLQQPEWHWGAPKADLEENWSSKEHGFFFNTYGHLNINLCYSTMYLGAIEIQHFPHRMSMFSL